MSLNTLQSMNSFTDKALNIDNRIVDGTASSLKKRVTCMPSSNGIISINPNIASIFSVYIGAGGTYTINILPLDSNYDVSGQSMTCAEFTLELHVSDNAFTSTIIVWPNNVISDTPISIVSKGLYKFMAIPGTSDLEWYCTSQKIINQYPSDPEVYTTKIGHVTITRTKTNSYGSNGMNMTERLIGGSASGYSLHTSTSENPDFRYLQITQLSIAILASNSPTYGYLQCNFDTNVFQSKLPLVIGVSQFLPVSGDTNNIGKLLLNNTSDINNFNKSFYSNSPEEFNSSYANEMFSMFNSLTNGTSTDAGAITIDLYTIY